MKKRSRLLLALLAVAMLLTLAAGCGSSDKDDTTTTTAGGGGGDTTTTAAPKLDFGGYELTLYANGYFPVEDPNASALNSEWLQDYADLEERLNIKIVKIEEDVKFDTFTAKAMAGEKIADLIWLRQNVWMPAAISGQILPVNGEKLTNLGLDCFDETRWVQTQGVLPTIFLGNYWGLRCASQYISIPCGYMVAFNKEIVSAAGYSDLYSVVRDMKWNWDAYMDIAQKACRDTNGDGVYDIYGTAATAWGNEILLNDAYYIQERDGEYVITFDEPAGIEALEFIAQLNGPTRAVGTNTEIRQQFADGYVAFNWVTMGHLEPDSIIAKSLIEYGVIPAPMGPRATEYYLPNVDQDVLTIMTCNKDLEKVIPIINEWALVVNNDRWTERIDDGRFRTADDEDMFYNYIIKTYRLNNMKMSDMIQMYIDGGIISGVSYNGASPQQAIEEYKETIQAELDAFFKK